MLDIMDAEDDRADRKYSNKDTSLPEQDPGR